MKKLIVAVTLLTAGVAVAFELVGPKGAATVVVPEQAEPSTLLAAEELTNYVARITGNVLEVKVRGRGQERNVKDSSVDLNLQPQPPRVIIGTLATLKDIPAAARKALTASKSDESAWTGIVGDTLWIVGVGRVAELYATYRFLEDKLGVRWMKAANEHDDGEYVPRQDAIELAPFAEYREPDLAVRRIDTCGSVVSHVTRLGRTWAARNGLQAPPPYAFVGDNSPKRRPDQWAFYYPRVIDRQLRLGGGHTTFYGPITVEKYFKDHPEYFALVDGKRVPGKQLCITHPEVLKILRDTILRRFDESGGIGNYHFGLHDTPSGWCECERCRKLDGGDTYACGIPNISTRFNKMVKLVADEIWKVRPDANLSEWAYLTYREIPEGVRPDPRMKVQYCPHGRCYGHALDDPSCSRNVYLYDLLKKWIAITPGGVYTYDYYFAPPPPLYTCAEHTLAHDLRLYRRLGMAGWKDEEYFEDAIIVDSFKRQFGESVRDWYASNWQYLYVAGKLTWDTSLDVDEILADVESKYYGAAYPAMKRYHALRRRLWDAAPQCLGYPTGDQRRPNVLNPPGALEELRGYLDEAERLVEKVKKSGEGEHRNLATCAAAPLGAEGRAAEAAALRESQPGRPHSPYCGRLDRSAGQPERNGAIPLSNSTPGQLERNGDPHCSPSTFTSILRHRIALDRRWLNDYWIKPHEEMIAKRSQSLFAPRAKSGIVVDGVGDEADWAGACYVDRFSVPKALGSDGGALPSELATSVGILADADNFYFLCRAMEPKVGELVEKFRNHDDPTWHDDGFEIFLYPATADNRYYQIVVNTAGVIYDVSHPGCDPAAELGVEAAVKKGADGYTIEVRVPAKKLLALRDGDLWRCHFMRNRRIVDKLTPRATSFAVDGVMPHDTVGYRTLTVGSAILKNGGFEDADASGKPVGWSLVGKSEVVREGSGRVLRVDRGGATQLLWGGPLGQSDKPRRFTYSFRAKGGPVRVGFVRYTDTPDAKAPHGYRRTFHPESGKGGEYRPKGEGFSYFTGEYTIAPNEWIGLSFSNLNATPCLVDDVSVSLIR